MTAMVDSHPPPLDNLQDLLRRKREIDRSKSKYNLTETDCNLLLTNANEFTFKDGQVILERGASLESVYRVKQGSVMYTKDDVTMCEFSKGWFIGDTILLSGRAITHDDGTLVAKGNVTLLEMNLPFVRRLFEVDASLSVKFFRYVATKLSVLFQAVSDAQPINNSKEITRTASAPCVFFSPFSSTPSRNSGSSITSSSSSSSDNIPSTLSYSPKSSSPSSSPVFTQQRKKLSKRQSFVLAHTPYKVYTLDTNKNAVKTVHIKPTKLLIKTERLGMNFKTRILYSQIKNFVRTSTSSLTILFEHRAKTIFFKNIEDLEELYGIMQSVVETFAQPARKSSPTEPLSSSKGSPPSSPKGFFSPLNESQRAVDRELLATRGTRKQLKKGDVVVMEGDLYQRMYMLISGDLNISKNGQHLRTMHEGETFGVITLLNLRPYHVTVTVASETAEIVLVPGFKVFELVNSNAELAARIFQQAGMLLQQKIESIIQKSRRGSVSDIM